MLQPDDILTCEICNHPFRLKKGLYFSGVMIDFDHTIIELAICGPCLSKVSKTFVFKYIDERFNTVLRLNPRDTQFSVYGIRGELR